VGASVEAFAECFEDLDDPRTGNAGLHNLLEVLMIALCAVLCGAKYATDMAIFARAKEGYLREFLGLENGVPSHDTFSRVFRLLDPENFSGCFQRFTERFAAACQGVIAIDGKVLRRSFDKAQGKSPLHMVSAWGCDQGLVLAQIATDEKSNEITAIPKLLKLLSLEGTIVTVDALNCQREIAAQIVDQKGDYVMALKGNQGTLHADVSTFLDDPNAEAITTHTTVDGDHGRIETRTAAVSTHVKWLQEQHQWPGLQAVAKVTRVREAAQKTSTETAYYLLSRQLSAESLNSAVRKHWGIENRLHWCLDVVMDEDLARNRRDNGPHNLAILRHMALNVMRKDSTKSSLRGKFKLAAWDDGYLRKLLSQF
jgi:predicted transposase YbfD/YdcC